MTLENRELLKNRLNTAIDIMKKLADGASMTDVEVVEGIVYHIQRRSNLIASMREKGANPNSDGIDILPVADEPTRNMI
jgi:hypothetical protein